MLNRLHEQCTHEHAQVYRIVGDGCDKYKRLCPVCWTNLMGAGAFLKRGQLPPAEERPDLPVLHAGRGK